MAAKQRKTGKPRRQADTQTTTFGLRLGAMCDPIPKQLADQGIVIDPKDADHLERDNEAITRLAVRGLITSAQAHASRQKLMRSVTKACAEASGADAYKSAADRKPRKVKGGAK